MKVEALSIMCLTSMEEERNSILFAQIPHFLIGIQNGFSKVADLLTEVFLVDHVKTGKQLHQALILTLVDLHIAIKLLLNMLDPNVFNTSVYHFELKVRCLLSDII